MRLAPFVFFSLTLFAQDNLPDRSAIIGRQIAEQVRRSTTPVERQDVQDYVAKLGAKLGSPGFGYTFSVVMGRTKGLHEPIAIPGGYIFVPMGLVLTANDEAEFAGMLAQAIARTTRPLRFNSTTGSIPLIGVYSFHSILWPTDVMDQRREYELQAYASAILSMSRAGFDPAALLRYIERVQPLDRPRSPLPARADLITALQKAIGNLPPASYFESAEFYAIQEQVRLLPPH